MRRRPPPHRRADSRPVPIVMHLDTERGWRGRAPGPLAGENARSPDRYVSLIAARPGQPLAARARDAGIPVVETSPWAEFGVIAAAVLRHTILRRNVRIVHAHTAHAAALAALATLRTPARLVVTRRVDFPLRANPGSRWKYRRADGVIAISRAVADVMASGGVIPSRIEVIPSGVDRHDPRPSGHVTGSPHWGFRRMRWWSCRSRSSSATRTR